jgi:hypothetical protein
MQTYYIYNPLNVHIICGWYCRNIVTKMKRYDIHVDSSCVWFIFCRPFVDCKKCRIEYKF